MDANSKRLLKEKQHNVKEAEGNKTQVLDVREAVWNQLTKNDKEHIKRSWEDASVSKITLHETMGDIKDKTFIGKEVFIVDFPSNDNPTVGGFAVYADIKTHQLIGYGYRD
jgi:TRAP-type C4-dicarboxylate transport system substrate-binding protein